MRRRKRNSDEDFLVPFHVDNGMFLLITPFPQVALEVRLEDGNEISTSDVDSDVILVLIGRGLGDWLLQAEPEIQNRFYAVPHAVPSMAQIDVGLRTVYARMKVATMSAKPQHSTKTFGDVFMNEADWNDESQVCSALTSTLNRDAWVEAMDATCAQGEAYCWMGCYPLPAACPQVASARCFSDVNNVTCSTEPDGKPMDKTCKWHCKPQRQPQYALSDYCNGKMDMLMSGFEVAGDKTNPCVILFIEAWTLDSRWKFAIGCVGVFCIGFAIEALIWVRRRISKSRRRRFRTALLLATFAANLTLGYLAMLVAMTYSVELFCCVLLGLVVGHGVFNVKKAAIGETVDPCCANVNANDEQELNAASSLLAQNGAKCAKDANGEVC